MSSAGDTVGTSSVRWGWWALVFLLGACAGFAAMRGLETLRSEHAPSGWERVGPKIPFRTTGAATGSPPVAGAWNLDHYESLWGLEGVDTLEVTAAVPDGAVQRILLCSLRKEGLEGPGVIIDRSESPGSVRGVRVTPRAQTNLKCEGDELPPPTDDAYTVHLSRTDEKGRYRIRVGDAETECRGAVPQDGPAVVGGLARTAVMAITADGSRQAPLFHPLMFPLGLVLGGLVWAGFCALERRVGVSALGTAASSLPLALCVPLSLPEPEQVAESLQLMSLASPWLALAAGLVPTLLWKGLVHVGRASAGVHGDAPLPRRLEPWAMALAPVLPAAIGLALVPGEQGRPTVLGLALVGLGLGSSMCLVGLRRVAGLDGPSALKGTGALLGVFGTAVLLAWLGGAEQRSAAVMFGLAATALGGVAVARQAGSGGTGGLVLGTLLVATALGLLEHGVRHTSVVDRWVGTPEATATAAARSALDSFDALAAGVHPAVPRTAHPVAIPPDQGRLRVAVLGSSPVAGGPWADPLSEYFPARLAALAGDQVTVFNQGVGDWTTFHMRRYVEARLTDLAADVVVVYAGRRDLAATSPLTLAELHRHWQLHGTGGQPSLLQELRILQGARVLVTTLLDPPLRPAVPVGDAAENLAALATAVRAQGGRVLLVKQALAPDASALADYHAMLDDLAAAQDGVETLDAESLLQAAGTGHFVDDRHLTSTGATLLAQALYERLVALGWLDAPQEGFE